MWCGPGLALPGVTRSRHQCGLSQWPHALSQGWETVITNTVITLSVIITRGEHCMDILRWASSASSESPHCPLDVGDEVPRAGSCLPLSVVMGSGSGVMWCIPARGGHRTQGDVSRWPTSGDNTHSLQTAASGQWLQRGNQAPGVRWQSPEAPQRLWCQTLPGRMSSLSSLSSCHEKLAVGNKNISNVQRLFTPGQLINSKHQKEDCWGKHNHSLRSPPRAKWGNENCLVDDSEN